MGAIKDAGMFGLVLPVRPAAAGGEEDGLT
jgi:hypothetical protein